MRKKVTTEVTKSQKLHQTKKSKLQLKSRMKNNVSNLRKKGRLCRQILEQLVEELKASGKKPIEKQERSRIIRNTI